MADRSARLERWWSTEWCTWHRGTSESSKARKATWCWRSAWNSIGNMQLSKTLPKSWKKWAVAANVLAAACALYAADPAIITIASPNLFPESITSTSDGAIIIGSYGTSSIWRIPAGENNASKWIDASSAKGALLGVLA